MSVLLHVVLPCGATLSVEPAASGQIKVLKEEIARAAMLEASRFVLRFDGVELEEGMRVADAPFQDGSEVTVEYDRRQEARLKLKSMGYIGKQELHQLIQCRNDPVCSDVLRLMMEAGLGHEVDPQAVLLNASVLCLKETVSTLLTCFDVDINVTNRDGCSPLHCATLSQCNGIVSLLLENGACPNKKDECENTPLHFAASLRDADIVSALLTHGADPNIKSCFDGCTPLHRAAHEGHAGIVTLLLQHKADPNIRNISMKRPSDVAAGNGFCTVAALLREKKG
eukprot:TRINITY_DN11629_c0_g1_i2.p1 TRINITY_DN11629_c0_g1~~TRINITY_DN11629_c0_g1_i2.p1  ORF type:complete len:283 (+),score=50.35 TRINITY_DN11629_c0_g1_i2:35-883(+)